VSTRLASTFGAIKAANSKALCTYIMGGDGGADISLKLMHTLAESGADIIEIGFPFSDPMADGPVIQEAGRRALSCGTTLQKVIDIVAEFRRTNINTPVILMGYLNPVLKMGINLFADACKNAGIDGAIIVDIPVDETIGLADALDKQGIALIRLIAPTTTSERLQEICSKASGFLYLITVKGITGAATATNSELLQQIEIIRKLTSTPLLAGFGIKTASQAKQFAEITDGVVVGSSLVEIISKINSSNHTDIIAKAGSFVRSLSFRKGS